MPSIDILLGLLVAMVILVTLARRIGVAYPILLVIGGLALGFVPGLPRITLQPDLVLLFFLPPLLYWEALNIPLRDMRLKARPIILLAVGLVLATMCVVAVVAHMAIAGLTWPVAFVLGAIVAPTDEVAASAIAERLALPRRLVTLLEGESLINDASALVAYTVAVAAVVSGRFSLSGATMKFVWAVVGSVAVGLAVGWGIIWIRRRLNDPPVENTISLLSGYAAYLPAEWLGVSGVLSVVTMGIYLGRQGTRIVSSRTRLQAQEVWQVVVFLLNGLIFILVGLELHSILAALSLRSWPTLIWYAALVSLTVILVRIAWVFPTMYLPRALSRHERERYPSLPWQYPTIISWAGMRGGVSLAAALALPYSVSRAHVPFPQRDLVIFLTFCVILATLLLQGLSLPVLIRRLGLSEDGTPRREEAKAQLTAARAALARLDELAKRSQAPPEVVAHLRAHYEERSRLHMGRYRGEENEDDETYAVAFRRLQSALLQVEREAIIGLRDRGVINDEAMRTVQRSIDLEAVQMEA